MGSPFLVAFASAVVEELIRRERIEVMAGAGQRVAIFLANYLATEGKGRSLISCTVAGLFACDEVMELYADDAELKELMEDLPPSVLPRG